MNNTALLRLMHLVSPALPVGAYAYSQGQEYAVESGWIKTESQLIDWLFGIMHYSLANLDLPILSRCYRCWQQHDVAALNDWNDFLRANRETSELLLEDEQLGVALQRLLVSLELESAQQMFSAPPSFVTMFSLAGARWEIPETELLHGFAWSWLENQVAAATKTIPLGQTQAQKILVALTEDVACAVKKSVALEDSDLGLGLPGLALASAKHERQYSRLFRS